MNTDTALIIACATAREIMIDAEAHGLTDSFHLGRHTAAESILNTLPNPGDPTHLGDALRDGVSQQDKAAIRLLIDLMKKNYAREEFWRKRP